MKHFLVSLLVGFWLFGPHAFGAVNARNGVTISTSSTINGRTLNSAINGQTITAGGGGPSLIANTAAGAIASPTTITTSSIDTTGANFIVVAVSWYRNTTIATPTVSDSKSNTYTPLTRVDSPGTDARIQMFYAYAPTVGSGHTFTFSDSGLGVYASIMVAAFSGVSSSPFDLETGNSTGSSWTTLSNTSLTPSQANTIVFSALGFSANSGGAISIDSSYTITDTVADDPSDHLGGSLAYKVLSSATAQTPQWTTSLASSEGATTLASFKY